MITILTLYLHKVKQIPLKDATVAAFAFGLPLDVILVILLSNL